MNRSHRSAFRQVRCIWWGCVYGGMLGGWMSVVAHPSFSQTPPPAQTETAIARPILKTGSRGAEVAELQATLKLLGYYDGAVDGVYNEPTVIAVSRFQQAAGLRQDGIVGQVTWDRLFPATPGGSPTPATRPPTSTIATSPPTSAAPSQPAKPAATSSSQQDSNRPAAQPAPAADFPILRLGAKGSAVTGLQERLRAIGVFKGAADGVFGPETQAAVKAVQRKYQLEADGVVGPATWSAIMR